MMTKENMCRPYTTGSQHHGSPQMASKPRLSQGASGSVYSGDEGSGVEETYRVRLFEYL